MNVSFWGFSDPVSSWTHLAGALAAFIGGYFLIKKGAGSPARVTSLIIYTFSLIFLFSMSGVFHLLEPGGSARMVLQRLDHAGIWILIAGTFTPIHIILFRGAWRWLILLLVWTIAITGLVLEVIFFDSFPEWLTLTLYLGLGWIGALTGYKFKNSFHGESLHQLISGGIFYSLGAVIDFLRWPNPWPNVLGPHEIFHIFVLIAAAAHWRFIYAWADHPVANSLTFNVSIYPQKVYARAVSESFRFEADTLDDLKVKIRREVALKYHESVIPDIHLRYFNEETI